MVREKALVLSARLVKAGFKRSIAMAMAWIYAKNDLSLKVVRFQLKSGEVTSRVVSENISEYYTSKGTGRKPKEGQLLFVDMAKWIVGIPFIISTYEQNIINN